MKLPELNDPIPAGVTLGDHVVQYPPQYSMCAGCTTCEIVCALSHDGVVGPQHNRIFLERDTTELLHRIRACQQCDDHPCYEKCPRKDSAMCIDENNIVYIVEDACIGCGLCLKACRFDPPRINMVQDADRKKWKAKKCDMCRENPEGPQCIKWCPVCCIGLSSQQVDIPEVFLEHDAKNF